jgi:hypothetical protein
MKTTTLLIALIVLASCRENTSEQEPTPVIGKVETAPAEPEKELPKQAEKGPNKFPPISIYRGRKYSEALQRELDKRNAKRPVYVKIMRLVNAERGEDGGYISFSDSRGKLHNFVGWPYDTDLEFRHVEEYGETLVDDEKGKKFKVTYQLEAYWSDPAGKVVENLIVQKMERVN